MKNILLILLLFTCSFCSVQQNAGQYEIDSNMSKMHNCEISICKNVESCWYKVSTCTTKIKITNNQEHPVFIWLTNDPITQDSLRSVRNHFVWSGIGSLSIYHLMIGMDYVEPEKWPEKFHKNLFFKELELGDTFEFKITGKKSNLSEEEKIFFNKLRVFSTDIVETVLRNFRDFDYKRPEYKGNEIEIPISNQLFK